MGRARTFPTGPWVGLCHLEPSWRTDRTRRGQACGGEEGRRGQVVLSPWSSSPRLFGTLDLGTLARARRPRLRAASGKVGGTPASSLALLLLVGIPARGACFFASRADASTSRLPFGVGVVNSCNNCSTPVERTRNHIFSVDPCALART